MKVFLLLVIVAVLSAQLVDAKKDNVTTQMVEKQDTKEKSGNTRLSMDTPNKTQETQLSAGVNKPSNMTSNISSNTTVSPPANIEQNKSKKGNDAEEMKEKQDTKQKNNPRNKTQEAQLSAGVNKPPNKPTNVASNIKVPPPSNKQQSTFKLPDGIRIPAGIPTGIPADIVGKATKKLKNHFGKSGWHSTPKPIRKSVVKAFE